LGQSQPDNQRLSSPTQVGTSTDWDAPFQAGSEEGSVYAVKTNGRLYSWGKNHVGQLGHNNTSNAPYPITVGTDTTWSADQSKNAGGATCVGAIKTDGSLWTWGNGNAGQLGLNQNSDYSSPKQLPGTNWRSIGFTGTYGAMASKTDGSLFSWGQNAKGSLGHNNTTNYSSPRQVPGFQNAGVIGGRPQSFNVVTQEAQ